MNNYELTIIGGGLAGCEAAWQAASAGVKVALYEMRPSKMTAAHETGGLAELVCSNSLGSLLVDRGSGLLIHELQLLESLLVRVAMDTSVPAGGALAVDRQKFSSRVQQLLEAHKNIRLVREEVPEIPESPTIIASGPLTSKHLSASIAAFVGKDNLFFFDAIAPIIKGDSIDLNVAFLSSRYERGLDSEGDYLNCPFTQDQYTLFVQELVSAEKIQTRSFENEIGEGVIAGKGEFFERCLPVEELGRRGVKALAFGPMRPVGITDPKTGRWPYAVVQLRREDLLGENYNLVGFQTNLTFQEQARVFRMIPGLQNAQFLRYGQMHRNSFICAPEVVLPTLQSKTRPDLFFAGQLVGIEGYAGNIASGLVSGLNATRYLQGKPPVVLPAESMIGSLIGYISNADPERFQPMKANFGLLPDLDGIGRIKKRKRYQDKAERALSVIKEFKRKVDSE